MYSFTPMTEEELNSVVLLEEGIYDFQVIRSTRRLSKSNNSMAEIQLNVWDKEGKTHNIFDYLVFSKIPLNIKKVKHFCDSTGLSELYKRGELPEELSGLSGKLYIGTKEEQPKQNGGFYPKKNIVSDYVMTEKVDIKVDLSSNEFDDKEIPF